MREHFRSFDSKITFFAFADIITAVSGMLIFITLLLATDLGRPTDNRSQAANVQVQQQLDETLSQQVEVDSNNRNLQQLLTAAETAPASEKLETDITRLRAQLAEEKKKHVGVAEQLAASQSAVEARDRTLGLTALKAQIQQVIQEVESLARQEAQVRQEMAGLDQRVAGVQSKLLTLRQWEGKLWLIPDRSSTTKEPILAVVSGAGVKLQQFDHPDQAREFGGSSALTEFASYLGEAKALDQYFVFMVKPSGIALFGRLVKSARDKGFEVGFDAVEEDKNIYFSTPQVPDETTPPAPHPVSQGPAGGGGYSDPRGESTGPGTSGGTGVGGSSGAASTGEGRSEIPCGWGCGGGGRRSGTGSGAGSGTGSGVGNGTGSGVGSGTNSGAGTGTGSGAGNGAGAGVGSGAGSGAGNGTGSGTGKGAGSGIGESNGATAASGETNATAVGASTNTNGGERKAAGNSSASADSKKQQRPDVAQPTPPPAPKPKSWWQRFLAWVASWFK